MRLRLIAIIIACLGMLLAVYFIRPDWFGFCEKIATETQGPICPSPFAVEFGHPLLPLAVSFLIFSVLAFFTLQKTYTRWIKFSIVYGIIVLGLLITIPEIGYGMGGFGITLLDTRGLATLYAILYGLLSLALLGTSEIIERSERST